MAEIANAWLTLAADREQLKLARNILKTQQIICHLIQRRLEAGISSELDLRQAQIQMDAAQVNVARYLTLVAQDENAINLLAGSIVPAELLPDSISEKLAALKDIAPGLSSEVLLNRPDILQAENILKGANANNGAARANLFPRITLTTKYQRNEQRALKPLQIRIRYMEFYVSESLYRYSTPVQLWPV
ncbi:MAG: TolC family protein [Dissulfurimicrobium sp.]|uniref:TolC family protein n=1 Tax=Dissulfurimicrobium sp. TaxID=2022436 RepID=UPI00404AB369